MITADNIVLHELIGLRTEIVESMNNELLGFGGIIIDETKSMFILNTSRGIKKFPKDHNKWKFFLQNKAVILDGSNLCKRSYDRVKQK